MKIGIITENPFSIGGVQKVVNSAANAFCKKYDVDLICIAEELKIDRSLYGLNKEVSIIHPQELVSLQKGHFFYKGLRYINKKVFGSRTLKFLELMYIVPHDQKILVDYFTKNKYDVIIAVQLKYSILLGSVSNKLSCKCVGWQHSSYSAYFKIPRKYYWNQERLAAKYLAMLDGCVVLSDDDVSMYYRNLGLIVTRIYNPVEQYIIEPRKKKNSYNVLWVGRLVIEAKGLDYLIKVASLLTKNNSNYTFYLVGDGPDKDKIQNLISQRGLQERIVLCGATNKISDYYEKADILISTSRWEGFGLTIVEAMSFGIPVISFDNSGPREILSGTKAGILIDKFDINEFAAQLEQLLGDKDKRNKMSLAAQHRALDFTPDKIAKQWEFIFEGK